jgi:23S rRNA pseudouridine955/2504/2580 synthase/23S rRNA pseudouridine1911/1915/1917 synthase
MLDILWQDDRLLAVNKPAGLATVPGRDESKCVLDELASLGPLRMVHRLDKETSGVLLLAKDRDAQRNLCNQFMNRQVQKEYLALVVGKMTDDSGEINAPLCRSGKSDKFMTISKRGRPSVTRWQVIQRFRGLTLVKCFPLTGRTHQIRVHLKSIGHALAIDPLYNPPQGGWAEGILLSRYKRDYKEKKEGERPLINRLTLHAAKITFCDLSGNPVTVECEPAKDFRATVNMLRKYAAYSPC